MKKKLMLKTMILTIIFSLGSFSVFAEEIDNLPQERSLERLSAIVQRFGPPPKGLIISLVLLAALIVAAIVYYKKIAQKEGGENNEG